MVPLTGVSALVLVEGPLTEELLGPEMRAIGLARTLSAHMPVTLAAHRESRGEHDGLPVIPFRRRTLLLVVHSAAGGGAERAALVEAHSLRADHELIIAVLGGLDPRKGQDVAIRALARIAARYPEARLSLAGAPMDEDFAAGLPALASALGVSHRVSSLGQVEDVDALLRGADCVLAPSRGDWTPLALMEAMGRGCAGDRLEGGRHTPPSVVMR